MVNPAASELLSLLNSTWLFTSVSLLTALVFKSFVQLLARLLRRQFPIRVERWLGQTSQAHYIESCTVRVEDLFNYKRNLILNLYTHLLSLIRILYLQYNLRKHRYDLNQLMQISNGEQNSNNQRGKRKST